MTPPNQSSRNAHPAGFWPICLTEFWERLAFYGLQSILVLYLTKYLFDQRTPGEIWFVAPLGRVLDVSGQAMASTITGGYMMLVAIAPLVGGIMTDRYLGAQRAILLGGAIMAVGHALMAYEPALLLALLAIGIGSGLFRGAIAGQLGTLYDNESRRVEAYQLFFLAINFAGVAGPLLIGSLAEGIGWHCGFAAAAFSMSAAMLIYLSYLNRMRTQLPAPDSHLSAHTDGEARPWRFILPLIAGMGLLAVPNMQLFNAYLIWAERDFALAIFGFQVPASWLIGLDAALGIVILSGSVLAWRAIEQRFGIVPSLSRMAFGSLIVCCGVCVLIGAAAFDPSDKIPLVWPIAFQLLNGIGLAQILPSAMAIIGGKPGGKASSTALGAYFVTLFLASLVSTYLATRFGDMPVATFWMIHLGCTIVGAAILIVLKSAQARAAPSIAARV